ncbi:MAG: hypothetical protein LBR58_11095 [Propionibacteriaceae bacterium]|jgi:uncharacterized protein YukE|nr:hypothetical protein [Propionibacteriaceae bacterium]
MSDYSFDTRVDASADDLLAAAGYALNTIGKCAQLAQSVGNRALYSNDIWQGDSGEAFRSWIPQVLTWADELRRAGEDTAAVIRRYAEVVADAVACAEKIRIESQEVGLVVSGTIIYSPSEKMAEPDPALAAQFITEYDRAYRKYQLNIQQWAQFEAANKAWTVAVTTLNEETRQLQAFTESALSLFIPYYIDLVDESTDAAGAYVKFAERAADRDTRHAARKGSPVNRMNLLDKAGYRRDRVKVWKGASVAGKGLSVVFFGLSVYMDRRNGESREQAVTSGAAALAAGALTGAGIGSFIPVAGTAAGAVIGFVTCTVFSLGAAWFADAMVDSLYESDYYSEPTPLPRPALDTSGKTHQEEAGGNG